MVVFSVSTIGKCGREQCRDLGFYYSRYLCVARVIQNELLEWFISPCELILVLLL